LGSTLDPMVVRIQKIKEKIKMVGNEEWMIERKNNIIYILETHIIISKIFF
jgi:hypothetical protein